MPISAMSSPTGICAFIRPSTGLREPIYLKCAIVYVSLFIHDKKHSEVVTVQNVRPRCHPTRISVWACGDKLLRLSRRLL
jgi:hypothetical protein